MLLRLVALFLLPSACFVSLPTAALAADSTPARIERLLAAVGGRAVWARANFLYVAATHHELTVRDPFPNQIWNDFLAPRVRIEATIAGDARIRGIADGKGFRVRDRQSHPLSSDQLAEEHAWWESNIYRTLHRLAVNDRDLFARAVDEHRLDIYRRDGKRLNWILLNSRGEPIRFATWDSETASIFGPLVATPSGLKHPKWGCSPDGSFRFEITRFEIAESPPATVNFTAP